MEQVWAGSATLLDLMLYGSVSGNHTRPYLGTSAFSSTASALPIHGIVHSIPLVDDPLEGILEMLPGLLRLRLHGSTSASCTGSSDNMLCIYMLIHGAYECHGNCEGWSVQDLAEHLSPAASIIS